MTDGTKPAPRRGPAPWWASDPAVALWIAVLVGGYCGIGLWIPSIWADEGATASAIGRSWPDLWHLVHNIDAVHAVYYAVTKTLLAPVGISPVTLRIPSLIATAAAAGLLYLLARTWLDRSGAITAAAVFALLPRTTWMAIEGRSWALTALLAVAATLVLVRWSGRSAADRPAPWPLVGYAVLLGAGIAVEIYLVFLAAAHVLTLLASRRWRQCLWASVAATAGVLLAAPVLLAVPGQRAQLGDREPLTPTGWVGDVVVKQFFIGETPGDALVRVPRLVWSGASLVLAAVCWALVAWLVVDLLRRRRDGDPGGSSAAAGTRPVTRGAQRAILAWAAPVVLVGPVAVFGATFAGMNLYHPRYFSYAAPAVALLVAAGLRSIDRRWLRWGVLVVLVAATLPVFASQRDIHSKAGYDWSVAAQEVAAVSTDETAVYFGETPPTRTIAISYPAAFAHMRDLTLEVSPADHGSLTGSSAPLTAGLARSAPDDLVAVWSVRDPNLAKELAVFTEAGYTVVAQWTGPQTHVVALHREP
jgi:mannosyltransferase